MISLNTPKYNDFVSLLFSFFLEKRLCISSLLSYMRSNYSMLGAKTMTYEIVIEIVVSIYLTPTICSIFKIIANTSIYSKRNHNVEVCLMSTCSFLFFFFNIYFLSWCRRPTSYDNIQLSSKIQLILEKKYLKKKSRPWGWLVKKIQLIHFIGIHNNSISCMYYPFVFLIFVHIWSWNKSETGGWKPLTCFNPIIVTYVQI